jgi:hypothetical protein
VWRLARSCVCGVHDRHPLPSIPPVGPECQMAWWVWKLGRCDTPGAGRAVTVL